MIRRQPNEFVEVTQLGPLSVFHSTGLIGFKLKSNSSLLG